MKRFLRKCNAPALTAFLAVMVFSGVALAGSLTPPGSPASTMNTLEELFDSIAGTFDSSAITSDQNGSLIEHLKYIEENMGSLGVSSDSLDFDEFVDAMTLDADLSVASSGFDTTWNGNYFHMDGSVGIGTTTPASLLDISNASESVLTLSRNDSAVDAEELFGRIDFWNNDADVTDNIFARIEARANQEVQNDFTKTSDMFFYTINGNDGDSPTVSMRICYTGDVFIGTTSGCASGSGRLYVETDDPASQPVARFFNTNTGIGVQIITSGSDPSERALEIDSGLTNDTFVIWNSGNASLSGNFGPTTTDTYDLGSRTLRWRNIYANNASISNNLEVSNIASFSQLFVAGSSVGAIGPDSLDFDDFVDNMTLDADFNLASAGFSWNFGTTRVAIASSSPSEQLVVAGGTILHTASRDAEFLDFLNTTGITNDVFVSGRYAYLADGGSGLRIVDIANPASMSLVGTFNTSGSAFGVHVAGRYAYVADGSAGLQIIDVTNPSSPTLVGTYNTANAAENVYVSGRYAYVSDNFNFRVIDISDPTAPTEVGSYAVGAQDAFVQGRYAYVAGGIEGLVVLDISDPANPVQVGSYVPGDSYFAIVVSGRYAYIAAADGSFQIVDVANPASPVGKGTVTGLVFPADVAYAGRYAYVSDYYAGLKIYDVSDVNNPRFVGRATDNENTNTNGVAIAGKFAYVTDENGGLWSVDINGIETPAIYAGDLLSSQGTFYGNLDVGNNLYVRNALNVGPGGLHVDFGEVTIDASSSQTALRVNQRGTGDILRLYDGSTQVLTVFDGGNASLSGSFGPGADNTYDLGSSTLRWRDLYLASGSLHIGTSGDEAVIDYNVNDDYLAFKPDGSTTWMAILDGGNVGIGTTSPTTKLDVAGSTSVSSNFELTGYASLSNTLWVNKAGNHFTGVGTIPAFASIPARALDVYGSSWVNSTGGDLRVLSGSTVGAAITLLAYMDTTLTTLSSRYSLLATGAGATPPVGSLSIFNNSTNHFALTINPDDNMGVGNPSLGRAHAKLYVADLTAPGSAASSSFAIKSLETIGSVASISATSLTTGNALAITVPNSGFTGNVFQATKANGTTIASLSAAGAWENIGYASISDTLFVQQNRNVGIGTTAPSRLLHVASTGEGFLFRLSDSDGTCDLDPDSGGLTTSCSSDQSLKTNIVDASSVLPSLQAFRIRDYTMRSSGDRMTGVIAQEVQQTHPDLVTMNDKGILMVQSPNTWQLIKAIQELNGRIDALAIQGPVDVTSDSWFQTLFSRIVTAFADLLGIGFKEKTICLGDTCIDEEQLKELIQRDESGQSGGGSSDSSDTADIEEEQSSDSDENGSSDEPLPPTDGEETPIDSEDPAPSEEAVSDPEPAGEEAAPAEEEAPSEPESSEPAPETTE